MASRNNFVEESVNAGVKFLEENTININRFTENIKQRCNILEKVVKEKSLNKAKLFDLLNNRSELNDNGSLKENDVPSESKNAPVLVSNVKVEPVDAPAPKKRGRKPKIKAADSIKSERSSNSSDLSSKEDFAPKIQDNTEKEEMPAPTLLPPRLQKVKVEPNTRSTRSKAKNSTKLEKSVKLEKISLSSERKDSDVILEDNQVTILEISDSDEDFSKKDSEDNKKADEESKFKEPDAILNKNENKDAEKESQTENDNDFNESKRTRQQARKKSLETPSEVAETRSTRTKTRAMQKAEENVKEGAKLNETYVAQKLNETYVAKKPEEVMNATVTVENPKFAPVDLPKDLMTDDESEDESKSNKTKPIFSPYAKTTLKKKVEAFEKLNAVTQNSGLKVGKSKAETPNKEKPKVYTPMSSRFLAKLGSSSKSTKTTSYTKSSDSLASSKAESAKKVSQTDYSERERQRLEKEAIKKKELQASIEEKRRKREEKQLKAQQTREALEKEKQKQAEIIRLKEEKARLLLQEREAKVQKIKEEAEKKRMLIKLKGQELKDGYSTQSSHKIRDVIPIYMKQEAPPLPTPDCYDSDDEDHKKVFVRKPDWESAEAKKRAELIQLAAGDKIKNSFFCVAAQTPDLEEIFGNIDSRKLKRTSSAQWRKPPRFTMMPGWETFIAAEEDED